MLACTFPTPPLSKARCVAISTALGISSVQLLSEPVGCISSYDVFQRSSLCQTAAPPPREATTGDIGSQLRPGGGRLRLKVNARDASARVGNNPNNSGGVAQLPAHSRYGT